MGVCPASLGCLFALLGLPGMKIGASPVCCGVPSAFYQVTLHLHPFSSPLLTYAPLRVEMWGIAWVLKELCQAPLESIDGAGTPGRGEKRGRGSGVMPLRFTFTSISQES